MMHLVNNFYLPGNKHLSDLFVSEFAATDTMILTREVRTTTRKENYVCFARNKIGNDSKEVHTEGEIRKVNLWCTS